jgi:mRNA interferase HicA
MKRLELVKHILSQGCLILREDGNHTALFNPNNKQQTVLARTICKQLRIPFMQQLS